ncbi:conserved hypothetical protein [Geotrichum candidum]|uniref:Brl1/Brr6 domain-containing protein n=1 Tax=Geotrichum candidum TaxID=1173061 RepID=A0A0J9X7W7_GEOCN|nr:conserved hypothetical protein [Geotrichum candidum]
MESSFSSLSLGSQPATDTRNHRKVVSQQSDPFDVNAMLSSINESSLHTNAHNPSRNSTNRRDSSKFSLHSLGQALFDDLSSNNKDIEMSNTQPWPEVTPELAINDVEMKDVSVVPGKQVETEHSPTSSRKSRLRTTTEALLSPTAMGAELALGLSSSPTTPNRKTVAPAKTATKVTSPILNPVLELPLMPTNSETQEESPEHTPGSMQVSVLPPAPSTVSAAQSNTDSQAPSAMSATQSNIELQAPKDSTIHNIYPSSNNHYHQHHYDATLPQPWQEYSQQNNAKQSKNSTLYTISSYLQILSNFVFASFITYLLYHIFQIFLSDASFRRAKYITAAVAEAERCSREYVRNECRLDLRAPQLEEQCNSWEFCMDADPEIAVGTLKVHAEVLSEVINSFIEGFTVRSLVVGLSTAAIGFGIIYMSNFAFGYWRAKLYYNQAQAQQAIEMGRLKLK